jgi:hypothetical protein
MLIHPAAMKKVLSVCLLLTAACTGCSPETVETDGVAQGLAGATTVTLRGRVFYNDRRDHGLFSSRRTKTGAAGTRCGVAGVRDDGTACSTNWLGAYYAVVDVIERDEGFDRGESDCVTEDTLASVAVNADGSFTATFTPSDPCTSDDDTQPIIALKVRLRYCGGDWCFSLNSDDDTPYALYHPGASAQQPLPVLAGDDVDVGDMSFYPSGSSASSASNAAVAANYFASLVDTIVTVHGAGVPFYKSDFGEIQYIFPSTASATATTKSASKVVISTFEGGWPSGKTSAHEYGHVLMLRAWDGDYGFEGVGISAGDATIAPSRQIAFKEAWAELIAHAVFPATNGCELASFDDNSRKPLPGALGDGAQWRLNVTKALCDWYDARNDDDAALAGAGDHFAANDLYSMWLNLRNMYLTADEYGGDYSGEGLWFCDYVDYYMNVRKSAAAVGNASHADYVSSITDLVYNNNIACYLPSP